MAISERDVERYREEGIIVVPGLIDRPMLERIDGVIQRIVAAAAGVTAHDSVYDLEPTHTPAEPRVRRIKKPHLLDAVFWELIRSPQVVDVMRRLIGSPDLRLHGCKLNMKSAGYGSPVEWHTDWAFYPHTNDDVLAVGVMLDDFVEDNGPMLGIPGTHRDPVAWDHHQDGVFCGAMDLTRCRLDVSRAIKAMGPAGSCSFHHVRLVHGSAMNTSNRPRRLLLYEVAAADAWPLVNWTNLDEFDSRMIVGSPTLEPRLTAVPVRMPYPPAKAQGSIYENQTAVQNRYFSPPEPRAA